MCFDRWEHVEKDKYLLMQRIKRHILSSSSSIRACLPSSKVKELLFEKLELTEYSSANKFWRSLNYQGIYKCLAECQWAMWLTHVITSETCNNGIITETSIRQVMVSRSNYEDLFYKKKCSAKLWVNNCYWMFTSSSYVQNYFKNIFERVQVSKAASLLQKLQPYYNSLTVIQDSWNNCEWIFNHASRCKGMPFLLPFP